MSLPRLTRSLGFRLVAAMTRVSKETAVAAPSGSNSSPDQGPDELGLRPDVHLPDLVQEEGPGVGEEELALLVLQGVGRVALGRAEQLVLDDVVGDGGAVDLDEAVLPPAALLMDQPGGQLLARPALARDQDPAVGRGDPPDLLPEPLDGLALPDERVAGLEALAELDVLLLEPVLAEGVLDGQDDLVEREGLFQEVEGPELGRLDGRLDRAVAGDDHDLRPAPRGSRSS